MTTTQIALRIDELDCAEEVVLLQDQLNGSRGIQDLGFDVVNRRMVVSFEADQVSVDDIITRISKIGMHASREDQPRESVSKSGVQNLRLLLTLAAGIAITAGFVTHVATTGNLLAPFEVELLDSKQSNPVASQILYSLSIGLGL
ncbi:MAG TPA: cation transporter, partial [Pirellulaceae bacterium]|nr:cation transporter [Pirellulaceae bacterium]